MPTYLVNKIGESKFSKEENWLREILSGRYKNVTLNVESLKSNINGHLNGMKTILQDFRNIILSFNYQNNLNGLISYNYYYLFHLKNHSEAKDIDFNIKVPILFETKEDDRPNAVVYQCGYKSSVIEMDEKC